MSRIRAAWRTYRAHRRYLRALDARKSCCDGRCSTSDEARLVLVPRQRRPL